MYKYLKGKIIREARNSILLEVNCGVMETNYNEDTQCIGQKLIKVYWRFWVDINSLEKLSNSNTGYFSIKDDILDRIVCISICNKHNIRNHLSDITQIELPNRETKQYLSLLQSSLTKRNSDMEEWKNYNHLINWNY